MCLEEHSTRMLRLVSQVSRVDTGPCWPQLPSAAPADISARLRGGHASTSLPAAQTWCHARLSLCCPTVEGSAPPPALRQLQVASGSQLHLGCSLRLGTVAACNPAGAQSRLCARHLGFILMSPSGPAMRGLC